MSTRSCRSVDLISLGEGVRKPLGYVTDLFEVTNIFIYLSDNYLETRDARMFSWVPPTIWSFRQARPSTDGLADTLL